MRSASVSVQRIGTAWSAEELRLLRHLAEDGVPLQIIAARLRRSSSSVRNKATMQGISIRPRVEEGRESRVCEKSDQADTAASQ
jgi:hypothetical protein